MLALLVWLAGSVAGVWGIVHLGYGHEAKAFGLCSAVAVWLLGGANWIGQKLGNAVARQTEPSSREPYVTGLRPNEQERELLKRAATLHQKTGENQ